MTEEIETLNPVSGLSERFATKDFSSNPDSKKMIEFFEDENLSREISERLKMDFITGTELASFLSRTKTARLREELNAYVKTREWYEAVIVSYGLSNGILLSNGNRTLRIPTENGKFRALDPNVAEAIERFIGGSLSFSRMFDEIRRSGSDPDVILEIGCKKREPERCQVEKIEAGKPERAAVPESKKDLGNEWRKTERVQ